MSRSDASDDRKRFLNALREVLGLAPLYGHPEPPRAYAVELPDWIGDSVPRASDPDEARRVAAVSLSPPGEFMKISRALVRARERERPR